MASWSRIGQAHVAAGEAFAVAGEAPVEVWGETNVACVRDLLGEVGGVFVDAVALVEVHDHGAPARDIGLRQEAGDAAPELDLGHHFCIPLGPVRRSTRARESG